MAGTLLDTNAVSDLMRDHPSLKARAAAYTGRLCTSVLVRGEIRYGMDDVAFVEWWPTSIRRSNAR